jgi:hypothetical protein
MPWYISKPPPQAGLPSLPAPLLSRALWALGAAVARNAVPAPAPAQVSAYSARVGGVLGPAAHAPHVWVAPRSPRFCRRVLQSTNITTSCFMKCQWSITASEYSLSALGALCSACVQAVAVAGGLSLGEAGALLQGLARLPGGWVGWRTLFLPLDSRPCTGMCTSTCSGAVALWSPAAPVAL